MISADVKPGVKQEIKKLLGTYFLFDFGWYSIQLDIFHYKQSMRGRLLKDKIC